MAFERGENTKTIGEEVAKKIERVQWVVGSRKIN